MKRNKTNCNHSKAIPAINGLSGVLWCPDCGALRTLAMIGLTTACCTWKGWLYPTGHDDVVKQLERLGS